MKIYLNENDSDGIILDLQKLADIKYLRMNTTFSTRTAIEIYLKELWNEGKISNYDITFILICYGLEIDKLLNEFLK